MKKNLEREDSGDVLGALSRLSDNEANLMMKLEMLRCSLMEMNKMSEFINYI